MKYNSSYLMCCFAICAIAICVFRPQDSLAESIVEEYDSAGESASFQESATPRFYSRSKALLLSLVPAAGGELVGAALLSAGDTVGSNELAFTGMGIFLAGVVIGPSLGHYYLREPGRATLTLGARAVLAAAPFVYLGVRFRQLERKEPGSFSEDFGDGMEAIAVFAVFSVVVGIGVGALAAFDCVSAYRSAGRKNAENYRSNVRWSVVPTVLASSKKRTVPGAVFSMSF